MKTLLILVALVLAPIAVQAQTTYDGIDPGECETLSITGLSSDAWISTQKANIKLQLEPDVSGAGTGTQVALSACTTNSADTCKALKIIDSDNDGRPDTNILDGDSLGQRGVLIDMVAGWVFVDTVAYVDTGALVICGAVCGKK